MKPENRPPRCNALIWKGDEVVATIPLKGDEQWSFYRRSFWLGSDSYEMSLGSSILDEMESSDQKLKFEVRPGANKEKNFLTCDENLLSEMSELSGGSFIEKKIFHELKDALRQSVRKNYNY